MGIVRKQSLRNTLVTYLGFAIGAINTLVLYTKFLTAEYFGLVGVILSTAAVLMPIMAFGVQNTLVKFYSKYEHTKELNSFLMLMLLLPLVFIIPIAAFSFLANDIIGSFLATENAIVKDYVWYIFLIGFAMAYFEVFYAYAKVQMKSIFGNFMKEVFVRLGVSILLILVSFEVISVDFFLMALVGLYILRLIIMKIYAYSVKIIRFNFVFPADTKRIVKYSALIILGGSAAVILLEIDKVMINNFIAIENVAYYSVAIFIATVIAVPYRAMHQITYPLTAEILNRKDKPALATLYQKSSLTLFIIAGLVFLLIVLNINDLYTILPEAYRGGATVVFLIGLTKVYDSILGNSNAILYNSDYYRAILIMGVLLALLVVLLNYVFIPLYGLEGAALATFIAIFAYNSIKLWYVKAKFGILPFTIDTVKVIFLLLVVGFAFYFVSLPFNPILNILIKSLVITILYVLVIYRFKISEDVYAVLHKVIGKK